MLLPNLDQFIIAAEDGRVVLLQADSTAHKELTSFPGLKGKTWNHPVLVGDKLLCAMRQRQPATSCPWRSEYLRYRAASKIADRSGLWQHLIHHGF